MAKLCKDKNGADWCELGHGHKEMHRWSDADRIVYWAAYPLPPVGEVIVIDPDTMPEYKAFP